MSPASGSCPPAFSPLHLLTLVRIVQEALTNVARHADATTAAVRLKTEDQCLKVTVADDGCGFDTDGLDNVPGLGVAGMRERATLIGADLAVLSLPGKGTRVELTVPLMDGWDHAEAGAENKIENRIENRIGSGNPIHLFK